MSFVDVARIQKAVQDQNADDIIAYQSEQTTPHGFQRNLIVQFLADKIFLQALAYPEKIDSLLDFTHKTAEQLSEHVRSNFEDSPRAEDAIRRNEMRYGGGALYQAVLRQLEESVENASIQHVTPDPNRISSLPPNYWHVATVNGILLAKLTSLAFGQGSGSASIPQAEKDKLWDDVISKLLGRTIFSRENDPEPSALIIALGLLRGASATLQSTLKPHGDREGQGKAWVWYDGAFSKPKATWSWSDVTAAAQQGIRGEYADSFKLPGGLVEGYLSLGIKLNDQGEDSKASSAQDETAEQLLSGTFDWVSRQNADSAEIASRVHQAALASKLHEGLGIPLKQQRDQALQGLCEKSSDKIREHVVTLKGLSDGHDLPISDFYTVHLAQAELGSK
ncbi:hypothetical protein OC845_001622 [Tilletia horrida]|nr:hypothetical protein OC845_001622 [Tilletia horrida]